MANGTKTTDDMSIDAGRRDFLKRDVFKVIGSFL